MALKTQGKLTVKAEQAIAALLEKPTIEEAAKAAKVSRRTLCRWLQREDFQQRFREAQRAVFDDAILKMQAAAVEAVATLRKNLKCGNHFAENSAAIAILLHGRRAIELDELQERLARIEAALARQQKGK
jgi:hypothetical protein